MYPPLSLVRLCEKTARRDRDLLTKRISDDFNSFLRSSGITVQGITVTPNGWLNATVNNGPIFTKILDRSVRLPVAYCEKGKVLVTGRVGDRATSDGIEVLLRNGDNTEKVFLKTDELKASLPLVRKAKAMELFDTLCLKPLFPIQLFLRGEVRPSNYQGELFVDWVRCGLDAVHVWDITQSELRDVVPTDIFRTFVADIEFYGVLAFRLLLKLGMDAQRLEDYITDFCERRWIEARTDVFRVEEARKIISPAS